MKLLIYIFIGGGLGSVFRFLISQYTSRCWVVNQFPLGTFIINILGCFLIGLFSAIFIKNDHPLRYFFIAGFCGGFTTFSTFSGENILLFQNGQYIAMISYILLSVILGLLATFIGLQIPKN